MFRGLAWWLAFDFAWCFEPWVPRQLACITCKNIVRVVELGGTGRYAKRTTAVPLISLFSARGARFSPICLVLSAGLSFSLPVAPGCVESREVKQ